MRFDQTILDLAAMRARVHAQGAADRAGHAAQERQPVDAGFRRGLGDLRVQRGGAGDHPIVVRRFDGAEGAAAEPDDDAVDAAVAHDQIGAEADRRDRDLGGQRRAELGEIVLVGGREQRFAGPPTRNQV